MAVTRIALRKYWWMGSWLYAIQSTDREWDRQPPSFELSPLSPSVYSHKNWTYSWFLVSLARKQWLRLSRFYSSEFFVFRACSEIWSLSYQAELLWIWGGSSIGSGKRHLNSAISGFLARLRVLRRSLYSCCLVITGEASSYGRKLVQNLAILCPRLIIFHGQAIACSV